MFLSRLVLNARSRHVQRDLANCYEMHRTIMSGWGQTDASTARAVHEVLYRVEAEHALATILVQSQHAADWSRLPAGYLRQPSESKPLDGMLKHLAVGRCLRFRLFANPTRCIKNDAGAAKRIDIRPEAERVAWLTRKGIAAGFSIVSSGSAEAVRLGPVMALRGSPASGSREKRITVAGTLFEGVLRIDEPELFRAAAANGIGRAKAFGCGLLSVANVSGGP